MNKKSNLNHYIKELLSIGKDDEAIELANKMPDKEEFGKLMAFKEIFEKLTATRKLDKALELVNTMNSSYIKVKSLIMICANLIKIDAVEFDKKIALVKK
jgi:Ca2+-binding EF-hand superfamily protein